MMKLLSRLVALFVLAAAFGGSSVAIAFDETHLQKLKKLNACEECDLSGANLKRIDLWGANLKGANLSNATLKRASLWHADLTGANIEGANMRGARFCQTKMPWGLDNTHC